MTNITEEQIINELKAQLVALQQQIKDNTKVKRATYKTKDNVNVAIHLKTLNEMFETKSDLKELLISNTLNEKNEHILEFKADALDLFRELINKRFL